MLLFIFSFQGFWQAGLGQILAGWTKSNFGRLDLVKFWQVGLGQILAGWTRSNFGRLD